MLILMVQAPQKLYPNFHPCLTAHHMDKSGEIIPTDPKVINHNMLNLAQNFEFWLPHIVFRGGGRGTQIFGHNF